MAAINIYFKNEQTMGIKTHGKYRNYHFYRFREINKIIKSLNDVGINVNEFNGRLKVS